MSEKLINVAEAMKIILFIAILIATIGVVKIAVFHVLYPHGLGLAVIVDSTVALVYTVAIIIFVNYLDYKFRHLR
jgi:hypothetical protein